MHQVPAKTFLREEMALKWNRFRRHIESFAVIELSGGGAVCFWGLCICCVVLSSTNIALGETDDLTVDAYKSLVTSQQESVRSMLVEYKANAEFDPVLRTKGLLNGRILREEDSVAVLGNKRYANSRSLAFGEEGDELDDDYTAVYSGKDMRIREGNSLLLQRKKSAYSENNVFRNAILWPSTEAEFAHCQKDPAEAHFLPYFLNNENWEVLSTPELVDSEPCTVIRHKSGKRTLWVDSSLNYALRRYEHHDPIPGTAKWVLEYSDFQEVLPKLFLPMHIVAKHDLYEVGTQIVAGTFTNSVVVSNISVNNVPEDLFVLEPRPGDTIVDNINQKIYRYIPPSDDSLNANIEKARVELSYVKLEETSARDVLVAINAILVMVLASIWLTRLYMRRVVHHPK